MMQNLLSSLKVKLAEVQNLLKEKGKVVEKGERSVLTDTTDPGPGVERGGGGDHGQGARRRGGGSIHTPEALGEAAATDINETGATHEKEQEPLITDADVVFVIAPHAKITRFCFLVFVIPSFMYPGRETRRERRWFNLRVLFLTMIPRIVRPAETAEATMT